MSLKVINIPPANGQPATGLIILLHGWGANANDLPSLVPFLNLPDYHFLFPEAPFPHPYSSDGKMWYDFENQREEELVESRQLLIEWLASVEGISGVPLEKTILSGFSQGGAMTLDVGFNLPLAGLICLSGYLHFDPKAIEEKIIKPILILHGKHDHVVLLSAARKSRDDLTAVGFPVEYHELEMGHEIIPAGIKLIRQFILETLAPTKSKSV